VRDEDQLDGAGYDYADCFEVPLPADDRRSAEELFRAGLRPAVLRHLIVLVHRHVLRFDLDTRTGADEVLGWRIVTSTHDVVVLEAAGPVMRAVLVGRRDPAGWLRLTSFLFRRRPRTGRALWAVVGPIHRLVAPYLLGRAVAAEGGRIAGLTGCAPIRGRAPTPRSPDCRYAVGSKRTTKVRRLPARVRRLTSL
jgi:hypothetical protein